MQLTDQEFIRLRDYMYNNYGINLAQKRTLIEGRLSNIVEGKGFSSFTPYIDNLMKDKSGEEVSVLVSRLTTNFTYFMREEDHFKVLTQQVLPEILPTIRNNNLSIWSAGCSSGEEPYTIAMVLSEYFRTGKHGLDTKVLATDISDNVLGAAKNGIFTEDRLSRLPDGWRKKYFTELGDGKVQIKPVLKQEVIFRSFNLMDPIRFKRKFHVIFCRNVMIYFDSQTRAKLAQKYYDVLEPGGYLMIGMSETLANTNTGLQYVRPSIYRRPR